MFRRLMNVLFRNRKSKTNTDNVVKIEYATLDMENNVHSSTHSVLNSTANDASGVYETINSTFQDHRYPPALNSHLNSADSPALSVLSNTACDGSDLFLSNSFWAGMLKIQRNFQEASQYYEALTSPTGNIDVISGDVDNPSVERNNHFSVSCENSESTMSIAVSLPIDINTSDVSITDAEFKHFKFEQGSMAYMATLNLLQTEKEFVHHLAALQKFREVLTRVLSKEHEAIMFQNMNELGVISELCTDEIRVILNAFQRPNLSRDSSTNDTAAEGQLTVEDIYDACFPVFREAHDAYIHSLDKALALCNELHRSTSFFSDVMTEQQFELLKYLLASPTYHPMNIATALQEVQKAIIRPKNLDQSSMDNENSLSFSDIVDENLIVSFKSTFVHREDNTYITPVDVVSKYLSLTNSDNTYLSAAEDQDFTYLSPMDSDSMRLSPVGQDNSYLSYVDPELITRRQFLSHYQQQGLSSDMSAGEVDRVSKFKRGHIMRASRREYVRNRFRSTNVFITLVEDM